MNEKIFNSILDYIIFLLAITAVGSGIVYLMLMFSRAMRAFLGVN